MHATTLAGHLHSLDPSRSHADLFNEVLLRVGELDSDDEQCLHNCLHWFIHDTIERCKTAKSYYVKLEVVAFTIVNAKGEVFTFLIQSYDEEYPSSMPMGLSELD